MIIQLLKNIKQKIFFHWTMEWSGIKEKAKSSTLIQLGSGIATNIPGAINVDINSSTNPDVLCDLNSPTYPFDDDYADVLVAISILEHLDDFFMAMSEIHRICKPSATVHILVPHFSSSAIYVDPTHKQLLSGQSCDYFISGTEIERDYGFYLDFRFKLAKRHIELAGLWNYIPPFRWLANKKTAFWEKYLCFIIRGSGIYWELVVVKNNVSSIKKVI